MVVAFGCLVLKTTICVTAEGTCCGSATADSVVEIGGNREVICVGEIADAGGAVATGLANSLSTGVVYVSDTHVKNSTNPVTSSSKDGVTVSDPDDDSAVGIRSIYVGITWYELMCKSAEGVLRRMDLLCLILLRRLFLLVMLLPFVRWRLRTCCRRLV